MNVKYQKKKCTENTSLKDGKENDSKEKITTNSSCLYSEKAMTSCTKCLQLRRYRDLQINWQYKWTEYIEEKERGKEKKRKERKKERLAVMWPLNSAKKGSLTAFQTSSGFMALMIFWIFSLSGECGLLSLKLISQTVLKKLHKHVCVCLCACQKHPFHKVNSQITFSCGWKKKAF